MFITVTENQSRHCSIQNYHHRKTSIAPTLFHSFTCHTFHGLAIHVICFSYLSSRFTNHANKIESLFCMVQRRIGKTEDYYYPNRKFLKGEYILLLADIISTK